MRILPVLDLLGGVVVRGVAGRRHEYRPIVSRLTLSSAPLDIARAFRTHFALAELYVADLDAIAGRTPALETFATLMHDGFRLWVDAGVGERGTTLEQIASLGVATLVAGLESLSGPGELRTYVERFGDRIVFSLDLKDGQPLTRAGAWSGDDAWSIATHALALGVRRLLVLDLAGVGMNAGTPTAELCGRLRTAHPELVLATGGGVRGPDDLRRLEELGVDVALVASALHDGRLTP